MIGNDPILYMAAIRFMDPERIFISEHVQSNRNVLMFALKRNGNLLKNLSEALEFINILLRSDRQVILAAVKQNGFALEFAEFIDQEIALEAVKQNRNAIEYAKEFQYDEQVLKVAYGQSGYDSLFEEELLLSKIVKDPECLLDEDISLRSDKKFMMKAVNSNPICIQYAWGELANDAIMYLNETILKNRRVISRVASVQPEYLLKVDADLMKDRDFILELVRNSGSASYYIPNEYKADREIMLAAIRSNFYAISSANVELFKDYSFIEEALDININVLGCLPRNAWHILQDRELILRLTRQNPLTLGFLIGNTEILGGGESFLKRYSCHQILQVLP